MKGHPQPGQARGAAGEVADATAVANKSKEAVGADGGGADPVGGGISEA